MGGELGRLMPAPLAAGIRSATGFSMRILLRQPYAGSSARSPARKRPKIAGCCAADAQTGAGGMTLWLSFCRWRAGCPGIRAPARPGRGRGRRTRRWPAKLAGTGGVAVLLLLAPMQGWEALDVALILALFGALAAVGFVKATSADGGGDPEEEDVDGEQVQAADPGIDG